MLNHKVLFQDIGFALFWALMRCLPFGGMVVLIQGTTSDAPMWIALAVCAAVVIWAIFIAALCTSAVPVLVWRYKDKHETRLIQIKEHKYRQIKICGIWFYLVMLEGGKRCKTALVLVWDSELFREQESRYTTMIDNNLTFKDNFEAFINGWRLSEVFETLKYQTFEGGRCK